MQAFEGIRVLDLTHVLAGPFATYQLALLGADVIKVESHDASDMSREIGLNEELNRDMMGIHFLSQGSNKRAITVDLKSEEGKAIFTKLVASADVLVENFKCGTLAKLGFSYNNLKKIKPGIIYCSMTGFGHTGPKSEHGAFDNVIQAYSGLMETTGFPDQSVLVGSPMLDYGTGAQAAFAISSALLRRERTGEGQHLDVAMLDCAITFMASSVVTHSVSGKTPERAPQGRNYIAAYGCFDAADARVMIGTFTAKQNERMWRVLGRDDLADLVKDMSIDDITKRRDEDEALLTEIIATKTADEWEAILNEGGVPAARIRDLGEALTSDQTKARKSTLTFPAPNAPDQDFRAVTAAFGADDDGPSYRSPPARLGQHNAEILAELGYSDEDIKAFATKGVI